MSIPKSKRRLSDIQYYKNAMDIHDEIYKIFKIDCDKYFNNKYTKKYIKIDDDIQILVSNQPYWLIVSKRNIILKNVNALLDDIVYADSIYPTCKFEFDMKHAYQTKAIASCRVLLNNFTLLYKIFKNDFNIEKHKNLLIDLDNEIQLLKNWRSNTNRLFSKFV